MNDIPKIRYISLSGGGLKGIAYLGAFKALMELDLWQEIEAMSGSSAGSIAALIGCTGWDYAKMLETFSSIDFERLLTTDSNFANVKYVGGILETTLDPINLSTNLISKYAIHSHKRLLKVIEKIVKSVSGHKNCTFEEWHILSLKYPSKGMKDVICAAGNLNTGFNQVFEWKNNYTKNVSISLAITASCAYPLYLEPVKIKEMYYVDCGVADNTTEEVFEEISGTPNDKLLCLVLSSRAGIERYTQGKILKEREIDDLIDYIHGVMALIKHSQSYNYMRSGYVPITAFIDTLGLGTFDFEQLRDVQDKLIESGRISVIEHIKRRFEPKITISVEKTVTTVTVT